MRRLRKHARPLVRAGLYLGVALVATVAVAYLVPSEPAPSPAMAHLAETCETALAMGLTRCEPEYQATALRTGLAGERIEWWLVHLDGPMGPKSVGFTVSHKDGAVVDIH